MIVLARTRTKENTVVLAAGDTLRLDANFVDYAMVAIYFAFVMLIGFAAKRALRGSG